MEIRILVADDDGNVHSASDPTIDPPDGGWMWVDAFAGDDDIAELLDLTDLYKLDRLAVRDAVLDLDMPKVDDFGSHLLIVLHGLASDSMQTHEIDCFLTDRHLVTVRNTDTPSIDALWSQVAHRPDLARVSIGELAGLLADFVTRRLLSVLEAFDERVEDLTDKALKADPTLLEDLTAVRTDLAGVRRVVHPQREALDVLRSTPSPILTDQGRRRFSDVFDVASRLATGLDEARSAIAETLDAYRGAEARQATEVSKVLTVYAALILPLSLITGYFGMNFENLPLIHTSWGWWAVTLVMMLVTFVSLGVFISLGWVRRPSGRRTGQTLGRGLIEATRAPVQIVGAVMEISTMPLRATGTRLRQVIDDDRDDVRTDAEPRNHGSE